MRPIEDSPGDLPQRPPARRGQLHPRLREATRALHRHVEDRIDLLRADLTVDRYRTILGLLYGYYEPLEPRLAAAMPAAPPRAFELIERTALLERDLLALGSSAAELASLPRCVDLPRTSSPSSAAGCLYVIEGASLGGQVIGRSLEQRLGIHGANGGSFFIGEGPRTPSRWRAVLDWIEDLAGAEDSGEAIVEAACETFRTIARWFERQRRHA